MTALRWIGRRSALAALLTIAAGGVLGVPAAAAAPRADLVVTGIKFHGGERIFGECCRSSSHTTDTVRNTGRRRARRSVLRYYLSPDSYRSAGDFPVGDRRIPALRPGRASKLGTSLAFDNVGARAQRRLRPGSYNAIACSDASRRVREQSEGNNCRVVPGGRFRVVRPALYRVTYAGTGSEVVNRRCPDPFPSYSNNTKTVTWENYAWNPVDLATPATVHPNPSERGHGDYTYRVRSQGDSDAPGDGTEKPYDYTWGDSYRDRMLMGAYLSRREPPAVLGFGPVGEGSPESSKSIHQFKLTVPESTVGRSSFQLPVRKANVTSETDEKPSGLRCSVRTTRNLSGRVGFVKDGRSPYTGPVGPIFRLDKKTLADILRRKHASDQGKLKFTVDVAESTTDEAFDPADVRVQQLLRGARNRRLARGARAPALLGRARFKPARDGHSSVARVQLKRSAFRKLKRRKRLRAVGVVTYTDAGGKKRTVRARFTLRAPRRR